MGDITNQKALNAVGNAFILTILLAERVKELRQGAKPLVETDTKDPGWIALQEICDGRITFKLPEKAND
jgi:DNA-directed RNA polymerase subunit K/omega